MRTLLSPKTILLCLVFFMTAFFISNRLFRGDPSGWKQIVTSDGRGYYAYLPALLIDQDLSYKTVVDKERNLLGLPGYQAGYLVKYGNRTFNKYFAGEALLLLPFFLLAMLFSFISGTGMDGYSFFFQSSAGIGALFYLLAGLFYLFKILKHFGIRDIVISFTLLAVLFGTNLFYYSMWQPTMSHVYSFFAINGFLWFFIRMITHPGLKNAVVTGLFIGIVILIRPTNGVVLLLVPFLFSNKDEMRVFLSGLRRKKGLLTAMMVPALLVLLIQPMLWYLQTGRFFIWSYRNEGFNFAGPEFRSVLFSFRKGLFVYTPLILLALAGLLPLIRRPLRLISMVLFLLTATWIIASWWNWYYGDGFGLRAFIDYYGIFAILIAILLNSLPVRMEKISLAAVLLPFIFLNLFQTWQYSHWIIQPYSMNLQKYKYVFLESDSLFMNCLGGNQELPGYMTDMSKPVHSTIHTFDTVVDIWNYAETRKLSQACSGKFANILDSVHIFSSGYMTRADRIAKIPATLYVVASLMVYDSVPGASNSANLVISMDSIDLRDNYYRRIRLNDIPGNPARTWRKCSFSFTLPGIKNPDGILKIYIWNTGRKVFYIDDFRIDFYLDPSE